MKAITKTIRELKQLVSREYSLVEVGVGEAWRLSELASSWGHEKAREWRNNKVYIVLQSTNTTLGLKTIEQHRRSRWLVTSYVKNSVGNVLGSLGNDS